MKFKDILPRTNVTHFKEKLWFTEYAYRIKKWLEGELQGPIRIDAEITRQCNSNCIFCSRRASKIDLNEESKRIEMPKERWVELVRESAELKVKNWNISGIGEPLMRADILFPLMEMIKAHNIFGELTTNGTLWKDEQVKKVVEIEWDSVCISIDGPNAKIHDSLRRIKAFKKASWTAKRFEFWKKKFSSDFPSITLNVVLNKMNYKKLPEIVKLAKNLGADGVFAEPMVLFSPIAKHLKLGKNEVKDLFFYVEKARNLGEKLGILPTISCVGVELEYDKKIVEKSSAAREIILNEAKKYKGILSLPCYAPWYFLMIRVDGSSIPCGELEEYVENVRNKSLREVWFSKNFEELRNRMKNHDLPLSCDKCRPNVINDIKQIRRAIIRYEDISNLQKEILELLDENMKLRKEISRLITGRRYEESEYEKELFKIKNSLTFKFFFWFGNTKVGRFIKKFFGRYA